MSISGAERTASILLDTSAFCRLQTGHPEVISLMAHAPLVYLPVIVIGGIEAAFALGRRRAEDLDALRELLDEPFVHILDVDRATAERYGDLVGQRRRAGTPIPTNDI